MNESRQINSIDELLDELAQVYDLPSETVVKFRNDIEEMLVTYLDSELNGMPTKSQIDLEANPYDIVESLKSNNKITITSGGTSLVDLIRDDKGIYNYRLYESINISDLNSNALVEAWKAKEADSLIPLIQNLKDIIN